MANETKAEKKKRLKAEKAAARQAKIDAGETVEDDEDEVEGEVYTYIGKGTEIPRRINFMGLQPFVRGQATEVTNPTVLKKLKGHPCFVEGEVDPDELDEADVAAEEEVKVKKAVEAKIEKEFKKKHHGE